MIVRLTRAGQDAVDAAMADLLERERSLLADLPAHDRDVLAGMLRRLLSPFEA